MVLAFMLVILKSWRGGVNNILDTNYTAPCKTVVINASDKVFDGFFSADSGMVPILLQPNEVIYKAFDANISVFLNLSDTSKSIDGSLSYGYNDGTPTVDNYSFDGQIEIQFSGDSEVKATYMYYYSNKWLKKTMFCFYI